jgi:imidazolonepropionase-like amidohydrolase
MEAIVACTRNNAFVVGLENDVGIVEAGRLADIIILQRDPLADIRVLQGGQHLAMVIKDGRIVDLDGQEEAAGMLAFTPAAAQV